MIWVSDIKLHGSYILHSSETYHSKCWPTPGQNSVNTVQSLHYMSKPLISM